MIKNKKVLVTGAGGFIGSHLTEKLLKEGCCVKALCHYRGDNRRGWLESLSKKTVNDIEIILGDIRDQGAVEAAVRGIDIVFHLAAQVSIPQSFASPQSTFETNANGTLNVMLAARSAGCEKVLLASTSEVYGDMQGSWIREEHPLHARSPYAASKIAAEKIAQSFFHTFEVPAVIVRSFNTYGPRQSQRAILSTVIEQLLNGANRIQVGSLEPTRDFVFVEDAVRGYIELAKAKTGAGQEVNIATGREISMAETCKILVSEINPKAKLVRDPRRVRPATSEVKRLAGDCGRLFELTGWRPKVSLEQGLRRTIQWFRENGCSEMADRYHV